MVLVTLGKACLLFYNCVIADTPSSSLHCLLMHRGVLGGTGWVEERLPSLTLLHRSLGDTGAAAGDEEALTTLPAPGAFIPAPLSGGL